MPQNIRTISIDDWKPKVPPDGGIELAQSLEGGGVLFLPKLTFIVEEEEQKFLDPRWLNGKSKNLSLEREGSSIQGAIGSGVELDKLGRMVGRFRTDELSPGPGRVPENILEKGRFAVARGRLSIEAHPWKANPEIVRQHPSIRITPRVEDW